MSDSLREQLTLWGLSDTEVDVYLAALEAGEAPASEVADRADVSRRHVYRISEQLEEIGLVDVRDQYQPTLLRAAPAEEVAEIMQRRQETILTEIDQRRGTTSESVGSVEVIKHMATVLDRCRTMLGEAEEWVFLTAPADLVETLAEDLRDARERGVVVMVFTEDVTALPDRSLEEVATVVRVREDFELFQQFALAVDYFRSLFGTPDAVNRHAAERFGPALYVEGKYVTPRINASFVDYEWKLGVERVVPEPAPLPANFDGFTGAVLHTALHRAAGTDLRATVTGFQVRADGSEGELATVEGDVVDVKQGIVEPTDKSFLFEQTITVDTGEDVVSVGGRGATFEDYAARRVELERADDEDGDG